MPSSNRIAAIVKMAVLAETIIEQLSDTTKVYKSLQELLQESNFLRKQFYRNLTNLKI